jgi:hypothetical protein
MEEENVKSNQEQAEDSSEELLRQLRDRLYSESISVRRKAGFHLSWMQEDGLEILKQVLFGTCPKKTKNAAAYGLRSMRGRMRKVAFDVLAEGADSSDRETRQVCEHALAIITKKWPQRFAEEVEKRLGRVEIKEIPPKRASRKNVRRRIK